MTDVFEVKEMAPPLPSEVREMKVHVRKEVEVDNVGRDVGVKVHSVYGDVIHDWELNDNGGESEVCFLTHLVKEELEEVKDMVVLSIRPEQKIP